MTRVYHRQPKETPIWYNSVHYPFRTLGQLENKGRLTLGRERSYIDNGKVRTLIDVRSFKDGKDYTLVLWERGPVYQFLAHWRDRGRAPWVVMVERIDTPSAVLTLERVS